MAFRVLRNTAVHLPWASKAEHLNVLNYKMLVSGYSDGFRVKVIEGGLRGYLNHLYHCQVENRPINQPRNIEASRRKKKHRSCNWVSDGSVKYDSALFIPATPGSVLAKEIRKIEAENRQGRETRIRVVELSGKTVRNMVGRSYPWSNRKCNSDDCFPCQTNNGSWIQDCLYPLPSKRYNSGILWRIWQELVHKRQGTLKGVQRRNFIQLYGNP